MKKNTILALFLTFLIFSSLTADDFYGRLITERILSEETPATGNATGERYRFIDDAAYAGRSGSGTGVRSYLYAGTTPVSVTEDDQTLYITTDVRGSVRALTDRYGTVTALSDYDAFGVPLTADAVRQCGLGYAGKPFDFTTQLYNYGFRDYSPETGRFTTVDPIRYGQNWYAYGASDPVNNVDLWGLAPKNMSRKDREAYMAIVQAYAAYDLKKGTTLDVPSAYDCADVATFIYGQATAATSQGNQAGNLQHEGSSIGNNISVIHSSDFFTDQPENISFYEDKSFNNPDVEVGTVMVWLGPGLDVEDGWIGHVATVVDVARDTEGNVTEINIIQGHTGGNRTEVVRIPDQADLDKYLGTFLGFGEIGENSTQSCGMRTY